MNDKEMEALEFAFERHAGQVDKQDKPYILHVLRVAFENYANCSENVFISALLHDVVEDCNVPLKQIEKRFGKRIAEAVDHLSRRSKESYSAYILRLRGDQIAVRVKTADLSDNLRESRIGTLPEKDQKRLRKKYGQALALLS
jgi:(p)ppGpp synthase/HD superfamily hydrolase